MLKSLLLPLLFASTWKLKSKNTCSIHHSKLSAPRISLSYSYCFLLQYPFLSPFIFIENTFCFLNIKAFLTLQWFCRHHGVRQTLKRKQSRCPVTVYSNLRDSNQNKYGRFQSQSKMEPYSKSLIWWMIRFERVSSKTQAVKQRGKS